MGEPVEFVKRLRALRFDGDIANLTAAEQAFANEAARYKGYEALSDAFTLFFVETVPAFNTQIYPLVTAPVPTDHNFLIQKLVHAFNTLRASKMIAHSGYPLQGFTLLRNIYDDCILAAAVVQGLTTFEELAGVKAGEDFDQERMRKNRVAVERRVRRQMDGAESGLSSQVLESLRVVDRFYDFETHGGRVTAAFNFGFLLGTEPLATTPRFKENVFALFMNRYIETAWMAHRLLPLIQLPGATFNADWASKWAVIDGSFAHVVMSLFKSLNKPYFEAFCQFMDAKFPFGPERTFPLVGASQMPGGP
jgi:hypothetical protein